MRRIKKMLVPIGRLALFVLLALFLSRTLMLRTNFHLARGGRTWMVDDDGPADFHTIQEAINAATGGDSIYVYNGTYHENPTIVKSITLIGESKKSTIIDGDKTGSVIEVSAENVVITGFTIQNSSRQGGGVNAGIKLMRRQSNITGNHIEKNRIGIFVDTSQRNRIARNSIADNGQGISLSWSSEATVEANNITGNTYGITLARSSQNIIASNSITDGRSGGHGIYLTNSLNNTIQENGITDNGHGMWLSNSFDNIVVNNTIANNELLGIEIANSTNNMFYHNSFINNGWGSPSPKHVKIGNQTNTNTWDNDYPSGGNYWSDYEERYPDAHELDNSGLWDTPYTIDQNNQDNYPLIPEFPLWTILPLFMFSTLLATAVHRRKH